MIRKFEKHLSNFVFGAMDGTVTTFAVVAASAGADLSPIVIIILGAANLIGDGFSMGAGAYLSAKSERDLKIRNKELKLSKAENPVVDGAVTFGAFIVVGFVAILIYVFNAIFSLNIDKRSLFIVSMIMTGLSFIGIGLLKSHVTNTNRIRSAVETLFLGAIAAVLAYLLGFALESVLNV